MRKHILIVDDDENFLSSIKRTLRKYIKEGWDISFSSNGLESLKILKKKGHGVVLTD